ncbi:hypothetical protein BsWGS_08642 [Bradybaena similaris]
MVGPKLCQELRIDSPYAVSTRELSSPFSSIFWTESTSVMFSSSSTSMVPVVLKESAILRDLKQTRCSTHFVVSPYMQCRVGNKLRSPTYSHETHWVVYHASLKSFNQRGSTHCKPQIFQPIGIQQSAWLISCSSTVFLIQFPDSLFKLGCPGCPDSGIQKPTLEAVPD